MPFSCLPPGRPCKPVRTLAAAILAATLPLMAWSQSQAQTEVPPVLNVEAMCLLGTYCFGGTPADQASPTAPAAAMPEPKSPPIPAISAYKENYFDLALKNLGGEHPSPWVFKLGIKAPLLVGKDSANGLYFGYRMTGYWDIDADSAPFRDINHNPSLFWLHDSKDERRLIRGWEIGVEHISNGQDNSSTGPNGTGTNRSRSIGVAAFAEPRLQWPEWGLTWQPRWWVPRSTSENHDIRGEWGLLWNNLNYRDVVELSTKGNPFNKGQAALKFHYSLSNLIQSASQARDMSAIRLSLTVFNGYGDGLLEYQQRRTWLRVGVTFSTYKN